MESSVLTVLYVRPFCMLTRTRCDVHALGFILSLARVFSPSSKGVREKVFMDRTIVGLVLGESSKSAPREDVNESYLTFIISQAIGCRHNLEFH